MSLVVEIKAEKLVEALNNLADAIKNSNVQNSQVVNDTDPIQQQQQTTTQTVMLTSQTAVPTQQTTQTQEPAQQTVQQPTPQATQQPQAVPTSAPAYTFDQLAVAATQLTDAGRREEVLQLLNSFGVQALTALPKEQYGAFATKLRELGAKI
mgnify:FL=1